MALTWAELSEKLAEPFAPGAVYWRAGSVSRDKKRAQALPYAEPRVYEDRLNALCPGLWSVSFHPWSDSRIICELTVGAVGETGEISFSTRASTGEENEGFAPGTAAEAQAFKRACSKFGLGRYLYDVPINWVDYDDNTRRLLQTPTLPERFASRHAPPQSAARAAHTVDDANAAKPRGKRTPAAESGARLLPPPTPLSNPQSSDVLGSTAAQRSGLLLSAKRADAMHRELEKLGLPRAEQHQLAASVLRRELAGFAELSESEALEVWNFAKRAQAEGRAVGF